MAPRTFFATDDLLWEKYLAVKVLFHSEKIKNKTNCYRCNVCVLLKFICCKHNAQGDGSNRGGLGLEGGALMNGVVHLLSH